MFKIRQLLLTFQPTHHIALFTPHTHHTHLTSHTHHTTSLPSLTTPPHSPHSPHHLTPHTHPHHLTPHTHHTTSLPTLTTLTTPPHSPHSPHQHSPYFPCQSHACFLWINPCLCHHCTLLCIRTDLDPVTVTLTRGLMTVLLIHSNWFPTLLPLWYPW